ncbi:hypothetical protein NFJ02_21g45130 [Pycnococcus provasolii]
MDNFNLSAELKWLEEEEDEPKRPPRPRRPPRPPRKGKHENPEDDDDDAILTACKLLFVRNSKFELRTPAQE